MKSTVNIDELIEIVRNGGAVRTGLDVFNSRGVLLIEKTVLVKSVNSLLALKQNGLLEVPVDFSQSGGAWDANGNLIEIAEPISDQIETPEDLQISESEIGARLKKIAHMKKEANILHDRAKENMKRIMEQIKSTGGQFDQSIIECTIDEIFLFLTENGNAFSYLAKDLLAYDDYLYNHSVNVCTLGTAIMLHFNEYLGGLINTQLNHLFINNTKLARREHTTSFIMYYPEEVKEIAMGLFLHDIGKVFVIEQVLSKMGKLDREDLKMYESHSYKLGHDILKKNGVQNAFIHNIVRYHHCPLFRGEKKSYPAEKLPIEIPPYVKICKLVDSFDASTSRRAHKEADSPVSVVTRIFRTYAGKEDIMLQMILHAFVSVVGIFPTGSIVHLRNGQLAYVLDSKGPICVPFTDTYGNPLARPQAPFDVSCLPEEETELAIDRRRPPLPPGDTYGILPEYLKQ
jgi:HD-GYP domain-containing protein (c-di-GMP phosphodiesterase class II)